MMILRKKNVINVVVSGLCQIIILILGLVIPRIILINYGSDTNGVVNTLTQIFSYAALLEAGIGLATKNALYPYLVQHDSYNVSKVMSVSRQYYRKISLFYLLVCIALSFLTPIIIKSNLDYWTIFGITFFEGLGNAICFYFVEDWACLLNADGKNYIATIFDFSTRIIQYGVKITFAFLHFNFVFIEVAACFIAILKAVLYKLYSKKKYSWVSFSVQKGIKLPDRNLYVVNELCWAVFSSTDMILLSAFCSSQLSSVYSIYAMIFNALNAVLNAVFISLTYNLGQTYVNDKKRYSSLYNSYFSLFLGTMTTFMCSALILTLPFINLYTTNVTDVNYHYQYLPLLLCLVQLFSWSRYLGQNLMGISGNARKLAFLSLMETIMNITLSLVLIFFFDIYGVTLATVIALPIKALIVNIYCEVKILGRKPWKIFGIILVNYFVFGLAYIVSVFLNLNISNYYLFIGYGTVVFFVSFILTLIANLIVNKDFAIFCISRLKG